jgi:hypothetical protein
MRYMVVERFRPGAVAQIYRRFAEKGRMMPEGLNFIDSWITDDLSVCYQLMEAHDVALFAEWTRNWDDLTDFEIVPVMTSAQARAKALGSA